MNPRFSGHGHPISKHHTSVNTVFPWPDPIHVFQRVGASFEFHKLLLGGGAYRTNLGQDAIRHITTHLAHVISSLLFPDQMIDRILIKLSVAIYGIVDDFQNVIPILKEKIKGV